MTTQPKVELSPEQAELTFLCAERIRAELDLYSVLVSKAEGPPISSLAAVCNIVFQLGVFIANTNGADPDWYYLGARELVAGVAAERAKRH